MSGDKHRRQFFAGFIATVCDDGEGFNAGHIEFLKIAKHVVLALRKIGESFFDCDYVATQVRKSHRVSR